MRFDRGQQGIAHAQYDGRARVGDVVEFEGVFREVEAHAGRLLVGIE